MKRLKISYWSDYACPFCYIGERNLKAAIQELGLADICDMEMRAFELHPGAPLVPMGKTVDLLANKYNLSREQAMEQIKRIEAMGSESGIQFDYENTQYTSTFDAHRLTKLALEEAGEEVADLLMEKLFEALFEKGQVLADHDCLKRLGVEAGLSPESIDELLAGDCYSNEVHMDEMAAARQDVHGVPYFILGNRYIVPGALPAADMKGVLEKVVEELGLEVPKAVVAGPVCGPDGCEF